MVGGPNPSFNNPLTDVKVSIDNVLCVCQVKEMRFLSRFKLTESV